MSGSQRNRRTRGTACRKSPKLRTIVGGLDLDAFEEGRQAAALASVAGYEAALGALHPDDLKAIRWYRGLLDNVRTIANLPPLPGGRLFAIDDDDDGEGIGPLGYAPG